MRYRRALAAGALILSLVMAFLLRDVVHDLIVVPLTFATWLVATVYVIVPQLVTWSALVLLLTIIGLSQLVRAPRRASPKRSQPTLEPGQVEPLAVWIHRARTSNYFRWQLANRIGRIARKIRGPARQDVLGTSRHVAVREYLAAGIEYSFVDFPGPRRRFQHAAPTPLDMDPAEVVDYLEHEVEIHGGRDA
jgi:hypothetical protein